MDKMDNNEVTDKIDEPDYREGHRNRMLLKLVESYGAGFTKADLIETLLFYVIPRQDVKPIAHRLVKHYGSLGGIFSSTKAELKTIDGVGNKVSTYLYNIGIVFNKINEEVIKSKEVFTHWDDLENYCCKMIGHFRSEKLLLIFLNKRLAIVHTEIIDEGTKDYILLNIRKIATLGIYRGADHLILSHNHPSGHLKPSAEDIKSTKHLADALRPLDINLLDHIIVSETEAVSLKNMGAL